MATTNAFKTINLPINAYLTTASTGHYVPEFEFGIKGRGMYDYEWVLVCAAIAAFVMAAGIGANDVANSFATSVGSRTLKMWQALIIAGFCEFFGAYLLGARVTETIKSGIVDIKSFTNHEDLLMFGMFCAVFCVGIWLFAATAAELPVSTTHSIVGGIIGFGLCSPAGGAAVKWDGVGQIVGSWFLSPLLSCVLSATLFFCIRRFILRNDNAFDRTFLFLPVLVFVTFVINIVFIIKKGGINKGQGIAETEAFGDDIMVAIAFGTAAGIAIISFFVGMRIKRTINGYSEAKLAAHFKNATGLTIQDAMAARGEKVVDENGEAGESKAPIVEEEPDSRGRVEKFVDRIFHQDEIFKALDDSEKVGSIHQNAEMFPVKAEIAFGYLQVFTACFASFAHGANDVANAIGPLAAVFSIYENGMGSATKSSKVPDWILVLGGVGLVFGLALYGHKIIAAMGVKMVKITPSRGFSAELSTAFVIMIGSFLGLPLSSTHTAVGAIVGLGLVEKNVGSSVNWRLLARVFGGWVFTLIVAGTTTALVFSFATFAPSQVYPLSKHNCLAFYSKLYNTTKGDPSTYTQFVDTQGTILGMYGYPVNGSISTKL